MLKIPLFRIFITLVQMLPVILKHSAWRDKTVGLYNLTLVFGISLVVGYCLKRRIKIVHDNPVVYNNSTEPHYAGVSPCDVLFEEKR